ncbi:esterase/lipase [Sphaerochaeta pleomorpha str. Grapes]|uniref:Esterase/lipase n=1 Tax=Sphaerochaeta pleomorpha (strain ATCC BAA-1885 / DSM 22778 / Grapes) TaxID=158190 RepID=G8QRF3_SPHPG|nr:alpha/beta hydrolase fold domain-containing protein [Sphaerochaeta pleomorpha]AEV28806.1 esterase/lipase [Sphaerochaeta pleomorpha str. Grapes]
MSATTDVAQSFLKLIKGKDLASRLYKNPPRGNGVMDARHFKSGFTLDTFEAQGKCVTTVSGKAPDGRHLLFFHGGSYVVEASAFHRRLIRALASKYPLTISFVDYPLAPESTWKATKAMVLETYREVVRRYPDHTFFLFGDSAGGGLALALLQALRDEKIVPFPKKTVLCSPWLDLALQNKQIADYDPIDPVLSVEGLRYAASLYSGGDDLSIPFLSPLFGTLDNLGEILLYAGTHEIFFPDCLLLQEKVGKAKDSSLSLVLGEGLMHDWVLFPSKEAKEVPAQIDEFLSYD